MQEIGYETRAAIVAVLCEAARCSGVLINGVSSVCETNLGHQKVRGLVRANT